PCTLDQCDGSNVTCQHPAGNAGAACPDDGNVCTTDLCNGSSTTCQHAAGNAGTVCRAAVNECDNAETCTWSSTTCPTHTVKSWSATCTDDGNPCTTDLCNGSTSSPACVHAAGNAGTVCRAAVNECDNAETCTGSSTTCPSDTVKSSATSCTDDGNV